MDSEDAMEKDFEKQKAQLIKEWQERVRKAIEDTRIDEQSKAKVEMDKVQ